MTAPTVDPELTHLDDAEQIGADALGSSSPVAHSTAPKWRRNLRLLGKVLFGKPSRIFAMAILIGYLVMAIWGRFFYPKRLPIDPYNIFSGPSKEHWLGTDFAGTDVWDLLVTGTEFVLLSALVAALLHMVIGVLVGTFSGYLLGKTDTVAMRITDFILTIPSLPLMVVLGSALKFSSPIAIGALLGILGWGGIARAVRSQVLSLRTRGFIEAAKNLGLPTSHIVLRQLLPNIAPFVGMNLLVSFTGAVYAQVGLFYLGILPFSSNNWGVMLNQAVKNGALQSSTGLSYLLTPLIAILLLTLAVVLLLDAVDEYFNPRLRGD